MGRAEEADIPAGFDPVAYINEPRHRESRLGLERTLLLLEKIGRPQDRLRFVHVAGTNGKGSTCAFLAQILQEAGYRTGLFTSPYIVEFADRIRVNGENIPPADLLSATLTVKAAADAMEDHPTEFELMTAIGFLHFAQQGCDIVVCEVGLGGRLDSTNVIEGPELCIITPIGLDHMAILGDTVPAIAGEKAGIIKKGAPVLSWPQRPEAMDVIQETAAKMGAPLTLPDFSQLKVLPPMMEGSEAGRAKGDGFSGGPKGDGSSCPARWFDYKGYHGLRISLLGSYQPFNAAMAIEAALLLRQKAWHISDDALRAGLANTVWPGRFEVFAQDPTFIIDGAHNVDGVQALVDSLVEAFPQAAPVFVVGILADKDYKGMLRLALPHAAQFVTITPPIARGIPAPRLAEAIRGLEAAAGIDPLQVPVYSAVDIPDALRHAREAADETGLVCAFGSLYSIADIKRYWREV